MSRARYRTQELDELISEVAVDCYDDDEVMMGFEAAFDERVRFPVAGTVVGEQVQVVSVARGDGRLELVTTCERAGRQYQVAVLDVDLTDTDATLLVAAYRRRLGP